VGTNSLVWDLRTVEELVKRKTTVISFNFDNIIDVDYVSFLIENDMDIEKAFLDFEKKLLISHKIVEGREYLTPLAVLQFTRRRELGRNELEEQYIKLLNLDISKSIVFREENIIDVVKNREVYRSMVDEVKEDTTKIKNQVKEVMKQLSHDQQLIVMNEQREALHHEIIGLRLSVVKDEYDELGNPLIIEERVARRTELIPVYYKLIEELKNHLYKNSKNKATVKNYLDSQKILENRIEVEKIEMIEKRKKFNKNKE